MYIRANAIRPYKNNRNMKRTKNLLLLAVLVPSFTTAQHVASKNNQPIFHSQTVPTGMKMVWNDEFNDHKLDTTKWFTSYYSTLDYYYRTNFDDFRTDNLPEPAMLFTDSTLILRTNDRIPERTFWESGRKISSIQTYDWNSNTNKMPDNVGDTLKPGSDAALPPMPRWQTARSGSIRRAPTLDII